MESAADTFPKPFSEFQNSPILVEQNKAKHAEALCVIGRHQNMLQLINEWLQNDVHSLSIEPAIDDDSDVAIGVSLILGSEREDLHAIHIPYTELNEVYPNIPSLADYTSLRDQSEQREQGRLDVDDEKLDAALGFNVDTLFDNDLQAPLLTPSQALRHALSYAISGSGEARFRRVSDNDRFEWGLFDTPLKNTCLYRVSLSYQWKEAVNGMIPGFGTYLYYSEGYSNFQND